VAREFPQHSMPTCVAEKFVDTPLDQNLRRQQIAAYYYDDNLVAGPPLIMWTTRCYPTEPGTRQPLSAAVIDRSRS
jgi:hypothetical protein